MSTAVYLNHLYEKYALGSLSKKEFEGYIFRHLLENYRQFYLKDWDQAQCADYLCGLYPRLTRAIDAYQDTGASFDSFIKAKVYWFVKERRIWDRDHRETERACWETWTDEREAAVREREPEYLEPPRLGKPVGNPRQALILFLKLYAFATDEFVVRIAPYLKMKPETLLSLLDAVRIRRQDRDCAIRRFQERLHSQYHRCIVFERRLKAASPDSVRHEVLKNRLERARKRYESMRKRYAGIRREASNRQIAEVLGVSKGTVDSNLFAVKQKLKPQGT